MQNIKRHYFPPGFFALNPGATTRVKHCPHAYPLPAGLAPGDVVVILSFDRGYYEVFKAAQKFSIHLTNIAKGEVAGPPGGQPFPRQAGKG